MKILFLLALSFVFSHSAIAERAAFSETGKEVYFRTNTKNSLTVLNMKTGGESKRSISLPNDEKIEFKAIARGQKNEFFLLSDNALWAWKSDSDAAQLVLKNSDSNVEYRNLTCHKRSGNIVIQAHLKDEDRNGSSYALFYYRPGNPLARTYLRHLWKDVILCPHYLEDGSLLFSVAGDLWHGNLSGHWKSKEGIEYVNLEAYRYAPISTRSAYNGTSSWEGVEEIVATERKVYVLRSRMGGSGWGAVMRLDAPSNGKNDDWQVNDDKVVEALRSLEEIMDNGGAAFLAVSSDRKIVHLSKGRYHYLVKDDGIAVKITQRGSVNTN